MKKRRFSKRRINNALIALLAITLCVMLTYLFFRGRNANEAESDLRNHPAVPFTTNSVTIPDLVEFCGATIPLSRWDMRERFDRELNGFTYLHSTTLLYFKRANRYFPIIEPILKANGIPDDFKYLCLIESNLDQRALSPAKAAGLWQFMESTGKSYGLEITSQVDERYHIEKATEAACKYFKDAYRRYGDWVNVAASYNAGMGRISGNQGSQMVESAFDMLLVSETSRYVFRILAIKEVFSHPRKYGFTFKREDFYPVIPVNYVMVDYSIPDLALFAKEQGIDYYQLKEFNPWLRETSLTVKPGKEYALAIPEAKDLSYNPAKTVVHDKNWMR